MRTVRSCAIGVAALAGALVLSSYSAPAQRAPAGSAARRPAIRDGHVPVPPRPRAVDTSQPDHGRRQRQAASSCTSAAVRRAVTRGGKITFDCGPRHKVIKMKTTAFVRNDRRPNVVIDGGGKITLSGVGKRRILYMNTCDPKLGWTTDHCQDQATPRLVLQNLTFTRGNSTGQRQEGGGGGAVFVRGGRSRSSTRASSTTAATTSGPTSAARRSGCWTSSTTGPSTSCTARSAVRRVTAAAAPTVGRCRASASPGWC